MKNKKLGILLEGMRHIQEEVKNKGKSEKQSTVKVTYKQGQFPTTVKAIQFYRLQSLFPQINITQVISDFTDYLSLPSQILGKRSSRIVLSKSSKYCLKIVQQPDILQIQVLFQSLHERFSNPESNCLSRIYFIFVIEHVIAGVKMTERYIIMPNIRSTFERELRTFDIKGHLNARVIDEEDFVDFKFGKDENFVVSDELKMLRKNVSKQKIQSLIDQITEAAQYLSKQGIIDYSLLFSFERVPQGESPMDKQKGICCQFNLDDNTLMKWMIIDYFQVYNEKKRLEGKFKSLFRKTVSSVEPEIYSQRLVDFLKKYLLC